MQRLLIASGSPVLATYLNRELIDRFHIEVSRDGDGTLALLHSFDPDILLLDTMIPGIDSYTVLHTLRASGRSTGVIVLSELTDRLTVTRLNKLAVSYILSKPCSLNSIISNILDLSFDLQHPDTEDWCIDNEIDRILLSLNFRIGPVRSKIVWYAVRYRYDNPDSSYMKEVCPAVAKRCGGSATQVEKAIRDAVRCAFTKGNKAIWQMYFPPQEGEDMKHPSGDAFISRIAHCLVQRARIKPPYEPHHTEAK